MRKRAAPRKEPTGDERAKWVKLACPTCSKSIEVLPGGQAWCTTCPNRPEMKALLEEEP